MAAKKVKKSDKVIGAYEAMTILKTLVVRAVICIFWRRRFMMKTAILLRRWKRFRIYHAKKNLPARCREYAETLQNELAENIELRREIEELYNYLQSIVKSLPDKIYELDKDGIVNFISRSKKIEGVNTA